MKKGVVTETLLYIAGGIIAALAIYYGVSSAIQLSEKGEQASFEILKKTITTDLGRISELYGSNRTFSYNLAPYTQICFLDIKKSDKIIDDTSAPEIIRQSIETGENFSNNVYLLGPTTDSFYAGEISVCKKNLSCFNTSQGITKVNVYGGGGYALFDPCEEFKVSYPVVINWTVPKDEGFEIYPADFISPKTINLKANVTDSGGNKIVSITWMVTVTNVSGDGSTQIMPAIPVDAVSLISEFGPLTVTNYSKYYITIIATNNISKEGSFTFVREFAEPGKHYPYAKIVFPNATVVPSNTPINFSGIANDEDAGYLDYSWDFGDDSAIVSDSIFHGANSAVETQNESHSYSLNAVSRLVKFKVTNQQGYSAVDTKLLSIGNTVPSITINFPKMLQILSASSNQITVNFNFTPSDIEQATLNCDININGTRVAVDSLPSGQPYNYAYTLDAPAMGSLPIEYYWSVTCTDGIGVNSSPTVRFSVVREALAISPLSCSVVSGQSCSNGIRVLSLSGWTNAHVDYSASSYPYTLCCNLTNGSINYLTLSGTTQVMRLSSNLNAHASFDTGAYLVPIYFGTSGLANPPAINCWTQTSSCNTAANETCVLSLSSLSNAHVSTCDSGQGYVYPNIICCKAS